MCGLLGRFGAYGTGKADRKCKLDASTHVSEKCLQTGVLELKMATLRITDCSWRFQQKKVKEG
jgi:hypothetical protein